MDDNHINEFYVWFADEGLDQDALSAVMQQHDLRVVWGHRELPFVMVEFPVSAYAQDIKTALECITGVEGVSFVAKSHCCGVAPYGFNDPLYYKQSHLQDASFTEAWNITKGDELLVGVVDTGIDATHPDLAGKILQGKSFLNPMIYPDSTNTDDVYGHGTPVAGIITAVSDNGVGIVGAAPNAKIIPARIADGGADSYGTLLPAITWAVDQGCRVINASFGHYFTDKAARDVAAYAAQKGCALVFSAGNTGSLRYDTEVDAINCVVVAASNGLDKATYSDYGPSVTIAAPTDDFTTVTTYINNESLASVNLAANSACVYGNNNEQWVCLKSHVASTETRPGSDGGIYWASTKGRGTLVSQKTGLIYTDYWVSGRSYTQHPVAGNWDIYRTFDGTSASAPVVAAAIVLIMGANRGLVAGTTPAENQQNIQYIKAILKATADPMQDTGVGGGRLNVANAVRAAYMGSAAWAAAGQNTKGLFWPPAPEVYDAAKLHPATPQNVKHVKESSTSFTLSWDAVAESLSVEAMTPDLYFTAQPSVQAINTDGGTITYGTIDKAADDVTSTTTSYVSIVDRQALKDAASVLITAGASATSTQTMLETVLVAVQSACAVSDVVKTIEAISAEIQAFPTVQDVFNQVANLIAPVLITMQPAVVSSLPDGGVISYSTADSQYEDIGSAATVTDQAAEIILGIDNLITTIQAIPTVTDIMAKLDAVVSYAEAQATAADILLTGVAEQLITTVEGISEQSDTQHLVDTVTTLAQGADAFSLIGAYLETVQSTSTVVVSIIDTIRGPVIYIPMLRVSVKDPLKLLLKVADPLALRIIPRF